MLELDKKSVKERLEPTAKNKILKNNIDILKKVLRGDFTNSKNFTGFGGMIECIQDSKTREELKSFLSDEQLHLLEKSTTSAFYTPKEVICFCWEVVKKLGFNKGRILEPSCGTGLFFEYMPKCIRTNSDMVGIEIEPLSYQIAKTNHQDIKFFNQGYESYNEKDQDLIITSPPFGMILFKDKYNPDLNTPQLLFHDAFMIKSLRLLKEGGLCVGILPQYFLDSHCDNYSREKIANMAELIFSCRLPSGVYLNTKIVVDIVVFQKKSNPKKQSWKESSKVNLKCGHEYYINNYYIDNPNHILGKAKKFKSNDNIRKRTIEGVSIVSSLDYVNSNLIKLIKEIKPCY